MKRTQKAEMVAAARRVAESMASVGGPDLRGLDDDELVERLTAFAANTQRALSSLGLSFEQAQSAFSALGRMGAPAAPADHSVDGNKMVPPA